MTLRALRQSSSHWIIGWTKRSIHSPRRRCQSFIKLTHFSANIYRMNNLRNKSSPTSPYQPHLHLNDWAKKVQKNQISKRDPVCPLDSDQTRPKQPKPWPRADSSSLQAVTRHGTSKVKGPAQSTRGWVIGRRSRTSSRWSGESKER